MESMWRDFPAQILEMNVLTFLPITSLCRFRTVSKKWNRIISHPDFASSHARASSSEDYVLITVQVHRPFDSIGGWEVLDVVNNRFFTLSDDFLTKYVKQEGTVPVHVSYRDWDWRTILAADGGLFCLSYSFNHKISVLLVCNPILRTAKQLPRLPGWAGLYGRVVMSTDRVSMEYEIFVFNLNDDHYQPNAIDIYESKTGRWRTAISTVPPLRKPDRSWCCVSGFVKLNGLYKIFTHDDYLHPKVVFYDQYTYVASELGFDLPCGDDDNVNLVVSKDRLFCVTMRKTIVSQVRSLKIFEVILARKECVRFTEMPSELLNWVLGDDLYDNCDIDGDVEFFEEAIVSTGCANSILIYSCTGRSVAYSLLDKSWHLYSDRNLLQAHKLFKWVYHDLHGSNNCLSLCAP